MWIDVSYVELSGNVLIFSSFLNGYLPLFSDGSSCLVCSLPLPTCLVLRFIFLSRSFSLQPSNLLLPSILFHGRVLFAICGVFCLFGFFYFHCFLVDSWFRLCSVMVVLFWERKKEGKKLIAPFWRKNARKTQNKQKKTKKKFELILRVSSDRFLPTKTPILGCGKTSSLKQKTKRNTKNSIIKLQNSKTKCKQNTNTKQCVQNKTMKTRTITKQWQNKYEKTS